MSGQLRSGAAMLLFVAALGSSCRCGGSAAQAIGVHITAEPLLKATCVVLELRDPDGNAVASQSLERSPGKDDFTVAVYRGELPETVSFVARGMIGNACAAPLAMNVTSQAVTESFAPGPAGHVELELKAPPRTDDQDGDGYAAEGRGGSDCRDLDPAIHPGAAETCRTLVDLDCDGVAGCAAAGCPSGACASAPATRLEFTSAPQTVTAGQCSGELRVEPRDSAGNPAVVSPGAVAQLQRSPPANAGFYLDPGCTTAITSVALPNGAVGISYFKAMVAGTLEVSAEAMGLAAAVQQESVRAAAPAFVDFSTPPQTVVAGACSRPATVTVFDRFGNTSPVGTSTSLALAADGGITFFADEDCSQPAAEAPLSAGASSTTFHFQGPRGTREELTAAAPSLGVASQGVLIRSTVTSGACALFEGQVIANCPISPPLVSVEDAFLMFQAASNDNTAGSSEVRCLLADAGTVDCTRMASTGVVNVRWQTAELPRARVQHLQPTCAGSTTRVPIRQVADAGSTFLLFASDQTGSSVGGDDFYMARLADEQTVEISGAGCTTGRWALQVVELPGARVTRGVAGPLSGFTLVVPGLPDVDASRTFLLYSYSQAGSGADMCQRMVRGEISRRDGLVFHRGEGSTDCDNANINAISWERVELPGASSVQQLEVAMEDGGTSKEVIISPVNLDQTLVFAGGQWSAGQATGEGSYALDDVMGAMIGTHVLSSPTQLEVTRASNLGSARWTSFVVQLSP